MKRRLFWAIVIISIITIIGVAVGVGVGVGSQHKKKSSKPVSGASDLNSNYYIGGALNPAYYSKKGAFNGSGIALASQSFQGDEFGSIVLYFQHHSGTIRHVQLEDGQNGAWNGGSLSEIVAYDAKNGTPISAVAYALNGTSTWHVFYIDVDNHIRQRSGSNSSSLWEDGPVNALNLTANDADQVGMQACWYGSFYGDSDYASSKSDHDGSGASSYASEVGMHLWYASDDTTFQQYGWRSGDSDWTYQSNWTNKNGHAGVGCYSWGPGTVTYAMMVNMENTVEIWWKDTNTSLVSNGSHPINEWTNSSVGIPNVHPSSSLGYTNFLYAQAADTHAIHGYNISWHAEMTSIVQADDLVISTQGVDNGAGLPGTHMSVSTIPNPSGGDDLIVFYQLDGDDITEFTRDMDGGEWTYDQLPMIDP